MEVLDEDARIFLFHNFLTPEECDHIINMAEPHLERSGVVADEEGHSEISDIRTSNGMFLNRGHDPVIADIERRVARWTLLPMGNGEGFQVLKYTKDQKYDGHYDYFFDAASVSNGGNRYATVLIYLNDVEEGGETVFPNIPAPNGGVNGPEFSDCARHHLAAKPKKGNAVLFHSIKTTGELERRSLHTACPVLKGVKWSAPKWIHVGHYAVEGESPVRVDQHPQRNVGPNGCADNKVPECEEWAALGECEKNPVYMIGTKLRPGNCLLSCNRCDLLEDVGGKKEYAVKEHTQKTDKKKRN